MQLSEIWFDDKFILDTILFLYNYSNIKIAPLSCMLLFSKFIVYKFLYFYESNKKYILVIAFGFILFFEKSIFFTF